jgi:hypothetical protein
VAPGIGCPPDFTKPLCAMALAAKISSKTNWVGRGKTWSGSLSFRKNESLS